jgi:hypothetical protein
MRVNGKTTVEALLSSHPEAEEILDWYGIEINEYDSDMPLAELSRLEGLDIDDLLVDITATIAESHDDYEDEDEDDPAWEEDELEYVLGH